jgi:dipeptidyl aminopeptidase/acylaminoacyl peptidase
MPTPHHGYPVSQTPARRFFVLRIAATAAAPTDGAALSPLPIPQLPKGTTVDSIALSPDGRHLAVTSGYGESPAALHVFDMATGTERTWTGNPVYPYGPSYQSFPSWEETVAFSS